MNLDVILEKHLNFTLKNAAFSPSSHNSQPWEVALFISNEAINRMNDFLSQKRKGPFLVVALNRAKHLSALPAHRLEMMLSCGMYLESLLDALADKLTPDLLWLNDDNCAALPMAFWPKNWEPIAIIELDNSPSQKNSPFLVYYGERITNRAPYLSKSIEEKTLQELTKANSRFFPEIKEQTKITFITEPENIKQIANFVACHAQLDFSHAKTWKETYSYIRFGPRAIAKSNVGLPITQLFGPLPFWKRYFYQIFLSPPAMQILRHFGYPVIIGKQFGSLVAASSALGYVSFDQEQMTSQQQLKTGALLLNMWLRATQAKLSIHPVSIILQHSDIRREFQKQHNLPEGRGLLFFRLGFPSVNFPPSPKRHDMAHKLPLY